MESNFFCIGGHNVCLRFASTEVNGMNLLPSFAAFRLEARPAELLFTLTINDTLHPVKERKLVRKFDTGNGDTVVYQLPDGGYQYIIRDIHDRDCCLLVCNQDFSDCQCALNGDWVMRSFGLNDALMLVYAFAGSFHQTMLIHASCVMLRAQGTVHSSQGTVHSSQGTVHSSQGTEHSSQLVGAQPSMFNVQCSMSNVQCSMSNVQCSMSNVQSSMSNVQSSMFNVQCSMSNVQSSMFNVAYPFTAKSGTGKSTHTSLWMKYIEGAELLNDDNPIIRIEENGTPYIYGSPWSGKTPCYRNVKARLGAVTQIERAPANSIEWLSPVQAFATLLPACSSMKWDGPIYNNLCDSISRLIETTPVYTLHCLPDEEAARLCHRAIGKK